MDYTEEQKSTVKSLYYIVDSFERDGIYKEPIDDMFPNGETYERNVETLFKKGSILSRMEDGIIVYKDRYTHGVSMHEGKLYHEKMKDEELERLIAHGLLVGVAGEFAEAFLSAEDDEKELSSLISNQNEKIEYVEMYDDFHEADFAKRYNRVYGDMILLQLKMADVKDDMVYYQKKLREQIEPKLFQNPHYFNVYTAKTYSYTSKNFQTIEEIKQWLDIKNDRISLPVKWDASSGQYRLIYDSGYCHGSAKWEITLIRGEMPDEGEGFVDMLEESGALEWLEEQRRYEME